jgi:hypothetical protein
VLARDPGLQHVGAGGREPQGPLEQGVGLGDLVPVPARAILVLEQHELAGGVGARLAPGVVEEHEGEQPERLGLVGHQLGEGPGQADRLRGELAADQGIRGRGQVALVEDEVERGEHRGQALRQVLVARDLVGDPGGADLALGAHDPLRHRGLRHQEGAGHLRGGEPAQRPEREPHPGLRGERRVAAGEDEPQPVVGHRVRLLVLVLRALGRDQVAQLALLLLEAPLAPEPVECLVARGGGDPRTRVARCSVARPALQRHHEGLLDGLLGEVEVAEDADECGDRPPRLAPEQAVGLLGR